MLREVGISAEITLVEHGGLIRSLDDVPVPNFPPEPEPERAAPEDSLQHAEPEPEPETEPEPVPVPEPEPVPDGEKWRISVDGSNVQFIAGADSELQPALDVSDDPRGSRCCCEPAIGQLTLGCAGVANCKCGYVIIRRLDCPIDPTGDGISLARAHVSTHESSFVSVQIWIA